MEYANLFLTWFDKHISIYQVPNHIQVLYSLTSTISRVQ